MKTHLFPWPRGLAAASGFQRNLLLFVVLPLVLVSALAIRFGLEQASDFQKERLKKDLELVARAVRVPIGNALAEGDREAIQLSLQSVFTIGRVYGASVFDVDGVRLASAGVTERDLTASPIPDEIAATGQQQEGYRRVDGREVFSHFLPVFDNVGQIAGLIQINRRASDFDVVGQLTLIAWLVWGSLSLATIITVLLGHYGGIGRHVDKILDHMARIEHGDRRHRAPTTGPAEVSALAQGLNRMLDSIEAAEREVDDHRQSEQALLTRLKDNERMAAIGRMARGIAHELGAPLSVIDGRARRLEKAVDEDNRRHIAGIRDQVARLTRTVRQLLDYSRPAAVALRPLQLARVVNTMEDAIRPEADAAGLALTLAVHAPEVTVEGDAARLELALLNLLRNALQAARNTVAITLTREGGEAVVTISDDGPGLPEGPREQLLEPFFTTKASGEGTGLGLAIAHNVVDEHGGNLILENGETGGCRVSVRLPVYQGETGEGR